MQTGPYVAERLLPQVVREYCRLSGIGFQAFSDAWVLRLAQGATIKWIVGHKFDVNSSAVGELAQDKVATYAALSAAGVDAVPHYLVRSLPHEVVRVRRLHEALDGRAVVAKPLDGAGGRDVFCFASVDEALAMIRTSGEPAWALSPHLDLQSEYRLVLLDGVLLLAFEKTQPTLRGELKLFNLGLGAVALDIGEETLQQLLPIARPVMQTMALRLAAVDIVRLPDGSLCVLEVNDGISLEHYARQSATNKNRAVDVYEALVAAMFASVASKPA